MPRNPTGASFHLHLWLLEDLSTILQLRVVRALEHWKGGTHLTVKAIIMRMVEEAMRKQDAARE